MRFDKILFHGDIITLEEELPEARWVGIQDGKIAAIGNTDDYPREAGELLDLEGKTVLPGLIDSHVHGFTTGRTLYGINLSGVNSLREVFEIVAEVCAKNPGDGLISAIQLNTDALEEKRLPTRQELDRISSDRPIVINHQSLHSLSLNSKGLELSTLLDNYHSVHNLEQIRSGIIEVDADVFTVGHNLLTSVPEELQKQYLHACDEFVLSKGCTTIHALNGVDFLESGRLWQRYAGELGVHSVNYWENWNVQDAKELGLPRVGGCLCLDGARSTYTAAYSEPFFDKPNLRGFLAHKDIEVFSFIHDAHDNNMQAAMHAMGDRAIDQIIFAIDSVTKKLGKKDLRHRIEHFSSPTEQHIEMAVELGLALPMQPIWSELWDSRENSVLARILGEERAKNQEPFAKLVRAGAMVCGGSDSPVTAVNPIKGIHLLVNNTREERNVSVADALKIWTYNCAWAAHEEDIKGTIKTGKLADFTVVDKNPYRYTDAIDTIQVEMTIVEGKTLYSKSD